MTEEKIHDLHSFMEQVGVEIAAEYARIRMRATEDPGTAGDQGEENWAEVLRGWLPRNFEVVTKGRIISEDGVTSPQVDILVLDGTYPRKLLNKKLYLAAGVAAAFECKTTLKAAHVREAISTCVAIKRLFPPRFGTPYKEPHSPLVFGLLAHSHAWKSANSDPEEHIENGLRKADASLVPHPRCQLDLLCVADCAAWTSFKMAFVGPNQVPEWATLANIYGPSGSATTGYIGYTKDTNQAKVFTPLGVLVSQLSRKLAWEYRALRPLAEYYNKVNIAGAGRGDMRRWSSEIYSEAIRPRVEAGQLSNGERWDEWHVAFQ